MKNTKHPILKTKRIYFLVRKKDYNLFFIQILHTGIRKKFFVKSYADVIFFIAEEVLLACQSKFVEFWET